VNNLLFDFSSRVQVQTPW